VATAREKRLQAARAKRWAIKHPEKILAAKKRWRAKHPGAQGKKPTPQKRAYTKRWKAAHLGKVRAAKRNWIAKNKTRVNADRRGRYQTDPAFRLEQILRSRIHNAIKGRKSDRTLALTGCTAQFLMGYLEARFKLGMKWSNYGAVWEIDHRIPCASYDLSDPSHQRSCFHYSNLQPLFTPENRAKSAKMPPPHQAELL
jgi:hypothetical protein